MCCREITSRYDLPIVISENGLGAFDKLEDGQVHDQYRIDYLEEHFKNMHDAIYKDGVDLSMDEFYHQLNNDQRCLSCASSYSQSLFVPYFHTK